MQMRQVLLPSIAFGVGDTSFLLSVWVAASGKCEGRHKDLLAWPGGWQEKFNLLVTSLPNGGGFDGFFFCGVTRIKSLREATGRKLSPSICVSVCLCVRQSTNTIISSALECY